MDLNLRLFHFLNGLIGQSNIVDSVIYFFAVYLFVILLAVALFVVYRDYRLDSFLKFKANFFGLLITIASVLLVTEIFRVFFPFPRPFIGILAPHLFTTIGTSFPSAHTICMFGLATAMYFYDKRLSVLFGFSGILIGIARIASGVHYPIDILGGAVLGIFIGIIVEFFVRRKILK